MNLQIVRIADPGVPYNERLHLVAKRDLDLVYYCVFDTTRIGTRVEREATSTYWFSEKKVSAGDNVVLYTKSGVPSSIPNPEGGFTHFVFWGKSSTLWNGSNSCAVVVEILSWETTPQI